MSARAWMLLALVACSGSSTTNEEPAVCGDGRATGDEACDGADLRGRRCADLGFNSGTLACHARCGFDVRGCATVEICDNGIDDDGDGDKDCDDETCADDPSCDRCGDGVVSGDETCDDGNAVAGDCCDGCRAEAGCERERNGSAEEAMPIGAAQSLRGWIAPAGDVDVFAVAVPPGSTGVVTAETASFASDAQCFGATDTRLEVLDASGAVVAEDDDAGPGTCSRVRGAGLPPGEAFVRVTASPFAATPAFSYRLTVGLALSPCGDGVIDEGQECDDGNTAAGDGCSPACRLEDVLEREPDDTRETALGPLRVPVAVVAAIDPPSSGNVDSDWIALQVAAAGRLRIEALILDASSCAAKVVTASLYDGSGALVATAGMPGPDPRSCGFLEGDVAAGIVYVRIASRPAPGRYRLTVTAAR